MMIRLPWQQKKAMSLEHSYPGKHYNYKCWLRRIQDSNKSNTKGTTKITEWTEHFPEGNKTDNNLQAPKKQWRVRVVFKRISPALHSHTRVNYCSAPNVLTHRVNQQNLPVRLCWRPNVSSAPEDLAENLPQFSQLQRETKGGAFAVPKTGEYAAEDKTGPDVCKCASP